MEIRQPLISQNVERNTQQPRTSQVEKAEEKSANTVPVQVQAPVYQKGNESSFAKAESFRRSGGYDEPGPLVIKALEAYDSHERETKRDAIRQMMGVDLYA